MIQGRCDLGLSIVHMNVYNKQGVEKSSARGSSQPSTVNMAAALSP